MFATYKTICSLFPLSLETNQKGESAPSVSEGSRWVSGFLDGVCGVFSWGNMQMVLLDLMKYINGLYIQCFWLWIIIYFAIQILFEEQLKSFQTGEQSSFRNRESFMFQEFGGW